MQIVRGRGWLCVREDVLCVLGSAASVVCTRLQKVRWCPWEVQVTRVESPCCEILPGSSAFSRRVQVGWVRHEFAEIWYGLLQGLALPPANLCYVVVSDAVD